MSWTLKIRGAGGVMLSEYECPEHGRHDELVTRDANGDPPELAACTVMVDADAQCGAPSDLMVSAPRIRHPAFISTHRGKSDPPPFPEAMDTEPLADGMPYHEWKKQREKVWNDHDYKQWKDNT